MSVLIFKKEIFILRPIVILLLLILLMAANIGCGSSQAQQNPVPVIAKTQIRYTLDCTGYSNGSVYTRIAELKLLQPGLLSATGTVVYSPFDVRSFWATWNYSLSVDLLSGSITESPSASGNFVRTNDKLLTNYIATDTSQAIIWVCSIRD